MIGLGLFDRYGHNLEIKVDIYIRGCVTLNFVHKFPRNNLMKYDKVDWINDCLHDC